MNHLQRSARRCGVLALHVLSLSAAASPVQNLEVHSVAAEGSRLRVIDAEADVSAEVPQLAAVLMSHDDYPRFMPYVRECRVLHTRPEGDRLIYTRLQLPWIGARDYVVREWTEPRDFRRVSDAFEDHWEATPGALPEIAGVLRIRHDEGSWQFQRRPGGGTHVRYRFTVDPGGLPAFVVNLGNEQGVRSTLEAVANEAQRRTGVAQR